MKLFQTIVPALGFGLLALTAWSAAVGAYRRRDVRRLDILLVLIVQLVVAMAPTVVGAQRTLSSVLLLVLPYLLLRLIQHFKELPSALLGGTLAVALIAGASLVLVPTPRPQWVGTALFTYQISLFVFVAVALSVAAHRSAGVTARRLIFAAVGTWILVVIRSLALLASLDVETAERIVTLPRVLSTIMFACLYLAFATPRGLRKNWQRHELARFLAATSDREAEDRSVHAADDLERAALRAVAGSAVFVALRESLTSDQLVIRAATDRSLIGIALNGPLGALGKAYHHGGAQISPIAQAEAVLLPAFARAGVTVLVAPVATSVRRWGTIGVVQRRGSLFPHDDLRLLTQLGRYAGGILDHGQLVTEARDRERRAADRRLRETESRMSLMLDTITDYAILILDDRGHVVNWPDGARQVFGYTAAGIVDQSAAPLYEMTDDEFRAALAEAHAKGHLSREGVCRRRDGTRFFGSTLLRRLEPDPDDLRGFVIVTRDVTERRELEDRVRQGQKMEALGRLAGGIAHDFNNLLTAILGYADWLEAELPPSDTTRRQQVGEIQKAAERAAGLTRQLLAFSRQQVLQPAALDLHQTVTDLLPMLRRVIGEHIDIVEESAGTPPPILADRNQIEQIVVNLAVNARDAMPDGGRLTIHTEPLTIASAPEGSDLPAGLWVRLDVRDSGVGMDAATQARIFEPFFTTKEFGRGTGLGLATVYGIVKQMGGTIRVSSEPGAGSTFSVFLRATKISEGGAATALAGDTPRGSETIMLVEDEEAVRTLLSQVLQRHGYHVIVAEHPAAALALARAHQGRIDLVISDVVMPGGTGPELVEVLQAARPDLRALFISGYADAVLSRQGELPDSGHFLQKPFTAIDLLIKVRQILTLPVV